MPGRNPARPHAATRHPARARRWASIIGVLAATAPALAAQQAAAPRALTAADYARAERFLPWKALPLVRGVPTPPAWLPDGRFWYRVTTERGNEYFVVDPARRTRTAAFDQARLAAALAAASGTTLSAYRLPYPDFGQDARTISFQVGQQRFTCDVQGSACKPSRADTELPPSVRSPDGTRAVFIRDWNLWVRDLATGRETQLTTDGVPDFGYATDNAGWTRSDRPVVLWSPDSKKIATFQQDQRGVGEMYLVKTQVGHPELEAWKYPLPGDSVVTTIQRVVVEVDQPRVIRLKMPPDQHRTTYCDDISCQGDFSDVQWSPDASRLAFVSSSRGHKTAQLRVADARTGEVREVLRETVPTQYESGFNTANWRVLFGSNEVVWFSERDNWGHLYLYDLRTGRLKHRITRGDWPVLQLLRADEPTRTLYFVAAGREAANPYYRQLLRVRLDGREPELLTPEPGDHAVTLAPEGTTFVDQRSTPQQPPTTVLRSADGAVLMPLEQGDVSRLAALGWTPPTTFTVKARDGKTELYGLMFRPTDFDSTKTYPIINQIYPGPQVGSVGSWGFAAARGDARALAELGFVVVQIDAMGTPMRSKSFHDAYYGDMGDNGLPDQVAGMKHLAQRFRWIDLARAGIWGHSGGGYATAGAMFRYPDFFKVGVAEAGNHDNREYEDDWGERYQGLLVHGPDGGSSYDHQDNQSVAKNLKGKLLIAYGTGDDNVPPYNSLLVIDALIRANKDVDVLPLPNRTHGFTYEPYMIRRRWDYFVRNLLGATPPPEYEFRR